jgi:O-antigen/teichoic acid export membrane protein
MSVIGGKKIAMNTFFLLLSSIFNAVISIVTTSIIAKSIGPELYGKYTFSLSFIYIFSVLANFGLESFFIRETARNHANIAIIADIFHLKILLAIFTIISIILSAHILGYPSETILVIYILCAGLFFQILSESLLSVYRSIEKMHVTSLFSTLFRVLCAIIVIAAVYSGIGFYGIVSAFSIGNALIFAGVLIVFCREFNALRLSLALSKWLPLFRHGLPFYLSALLTMCYSKINILILSKFVTDREMGFFMAAVNLVENLYFIPTAFNTAVFPAFSRLYGSSFESLQNVFSRIMKYLIILTVAVVSGTILISEEVILLIYGHEFLPAVPLLNILIFMWFFNFFTNTHSSLLFSIQKEAAQVKIMATATILNILLNFILISLYGYVGAAYAASLIEGIVAAILTAALWKLKFRFSPGMYLIKLLPIVLLMALCVNFLLQFNLIAAITCGALLYAGLLFLLRVFDSDDIIFMKSIIKRGTAHE